MLSTPAYRTLYDRLVDGVRITVRYDPLGSGHVIVDRQSDDAERVSATMSVDGWHGWQRELADALVRYRGGPPIYWDTTCSASGRQTPDEQRDARAVEGWLGNDDLVLLADETDELVMPRACADALVRVIVFPTTAICDRGPFADALTTPR